MIAMTRNTVFILYGVLIVALAAVGFYMGKPKGKSELYAAGGAGLGALTSALLWQFWAKKKYANRT